MSLSNYRLMKLFIFLAGVSLTVLYFNDGAGRVQLGHVIILIAIILNFTDVSKINFSFIEIILLSLAFYILTIDILDFNHNNYNISYYRVASSSLYIFFNVLVMNFVRTSFNNFNYTSYVLLTLIATIVYCFLFIDYDNFSLLKGTPRLAAGFRNPNQLGYFAVILFSITYILWVFSNIKYKIILFFLYAISVFLSVISLSKASMLAIFIPTFFYLIFNLFNKIIFQKKINLFFIFSFLSIFLFFLLPSSFKKNLNFYNRLMSIADEDDSSLSARGYYTYFDSNLFELFFGKGYWASLYFHQLEIHSTFAALAINYGIIGFGFYAFFIFYWYTYIYSKNGLTGVLMICTPSILYGITHNGARFTFFYFLVAISISFFSKKK